MPGRWRPGRRWSSLRLPPRVPADDVHTIEKNLRQVVYFGTFAPWQGAELLLDAVNDPAWPVDVELVVIGDASKSEPGQTLAKHERVRAVGRLPHRDTLALVASSLASLSPKTYQLDAEVKTGLWPVKVIESLAVGTPVIATKIEDQLSFVQDSGGGVLIESSGAALAEAVAALAADPDAAIAMGQTGQRHVDEKHSLDVRADFMVGYLRSVSSR
ncbi:MAG: glycosyltransferase [Acidimicrobiales bacterium]